LCQHAGIDNTLDNSASYIASWLKHLQNDKKMIFSAASKAQKAVDYILDKNATPEPETTEE
jgi:antirestriction protein ArdC